MSETDEVVVEAPVMIDDTETAPTAEELEAERIAELDRLNFEAIEKANSIKPTKEQIQAQQLNRMQNIFVAKAHDIKRIALQKDGSNTYIDSQLEAYKDMYQNALNKEDDISKVIVAEYEAQQALVATLILQVQGIRIAIEKSINDGFDTSEILDKFEAMSLTIEHTNAEYMTKVVKGLLG